MMAVVDEVFKAFDVTVSEKTGTNCVPARGRIQRLSRSKLQGKSNPRPAISYASEAACWGIPYADDSGIVSRSSQGIA